MSMRLLGFLMGFASLAAPAAIACNGETSDSSFILWNGDGSTLMSGSIDDLKRVRRVVRGDGRVVLWTRIEGEEYVVFDAGVVARARSILDRGDGMDERQAALERDMNALEARQDAEEAELEREEAALDDRQEALDAQQDRLSEAMSRDLEALVREAIRTGKATRP